MSCNFMGETVEGNGNLKSEVRHVGNTSKINLIGALYVFVDQCTRAVRVEGDENMLGFVEMEVNSGWFDIECRNNI